MIEYIYLLLGVLFAGLGGELFVRGTVGLGHWLRISPGIVGATFAAFASSSPELSVSVSSALAGSPELALGTALGSNVVNVALVLACAIVISGIQCPRDIVRRDFPVALFVPLFAGVLCLDGELSRFDGLLMLAVFFVWLCAAVLEARKQRSAADEILGAHNGWRVIVACIVGFAFLVAAGDFIVVGAKGIAIASGVDEFIIGATIVAIGTSTPELATTLIAKLRGHDEVGLGTILGSNIFNGVFIVAVAAIIHPISVAWRETAVVLAFGFVALVFAYPSRTGFIARRRGVLLLVLYAAYLASILQR